MRNMNGPVSADLLHLMLEFKRCKGIFAPKQAATFLAMLGECFEECELLQPLIVPEPMRIFILANDNNRDAA